MDLSHFDNRKSGISLIGDVPWGTRFCQFYQTEKDMLEVVIPYFKAGLKDNELCVWVASDEVQRREAKEALKKFIPDYEKYLSREQVNVISYDQWFLAGQKSGETTVSWLDQAILSGFNGLRITFNIALEGNDGKAFPESDVINGYNVIALSVYQRDNFDTIRLMETVKKYQFALVRSIGKWELLRSSEVQVVKDALKRSEEKLRSLFSNMSEGFVYNRIVLDAKGKPCDCVLLEVNESFERLTGLVNKNIINKKLTQVLPGIEKDPVDWIGKFGEVALTGKPIQFEGYAQLLKRWYALSAFSPHKGYFAVTFSDITECKRAEDLLRESEKTLKRSYDELEKRVKERTAELFAAQQEIERGKRLSDIGTLAATVAHELRNPLAAIAMAASNIRRKAVGAPIEKNLNNIEKKVAESDQIINNLLFYSRIGKPHLKNTRIHSIIEECVDLVRKQSKKKVAIKKRLDVLKNISLEADPLQMKEVFYNILNNSYDAVMDAQGKIEINSGLSDGFVNISIKDNGEGIEEDSLLKVFDPFFTTKAKGTGLGLSVCRQIIELHGGRIEIQSARGEGTEVMIALRKEERLS